MNDFAAYVFYVNRPDLLRRSIDCFSDLWDALTVVDNSGGDGTDCYCPSTVERYVPPVPLSYSQSMNWMLADATEKKVDFIVHFHSDAYSTNPIAIQELLAYARQLKASEMDRWACLWTLYDVAWIVNPVAALDVGGWDTTFPDYYTDQVFKQRCKRRGWELIDTHIQGIGHDKGDGVGNGQQGSATINADPKLMFLHQMTFPFYSMLYQAMYGGPPGKEQGLVPFARPDLFP